MNKFWKNLNCLASDHPLPPALVSIFKSALGEDSTSLKYLTFVLSPNGPGGQIDRDVLEENFNMVDTARKYHLSLPEVQKAIQMFVERRAIPIREGAPTKEVGGLNGRNGNGYVAARREPPPLGPYPVCGATISRLDSRRSDGGEVVEVGEGYAMVYWAKAQKKTKVSISRLRDVRLFKVKSPAGESESNGAKGKRNGHGSSKGKGNGLITKVRARSTGKSVVRLGGKRAVNPMPGASPEPWLSSQRLYPPYVWADVFQRTAPVEIDLGAGDGVYAEARARREPERDFIAVERLLGRATKIAKKAVRHGLNNLKVVRIESWYFMKNLCVPGTVDAITLRYPDPWPKRRHHGNRILNKEFAQDASNAVRVGGLLKLTTDDLDYFEWAKKEVAQCTVWQIEDSWTGDEEPTSEFEELFAKEGRSVYRRAWRRA